ncbi:MAG TPA: ABC transporter permease subunit [Candidatus Competibacteraceae bacterium]|nr:ABC transporter permease subunit [Candidatus Competibacteraceae bacterium]
MYMILTVAAKEFRDGLRNRWVMAITLVFAVLAVGLGYFGAAASGRLGFTGLATTIASLSSLAVFLIPLIALLLAYDSVVGEDEQGTLLLLLSYPLSRLQLLTGKFLGHGAILAVSTALGFGVAGLVITLFSEQVQGGELWRALGFFILTAILLGWAFVALAYVISVLATEKSRAAGLALIVWFVLVLLYDLLLLGLLVATSGGQETVSTLPYLLLSNPTDVFRIANLIGFEAAQAYSGLTAIAAQNLLHPALLLFALLGWVMLPFALAAWLFQRRRT